APFTGPWPQPGLKYVGSLPGGTAPIGASLVHTPLAIETSAVAVAVTESDLMPSTCATCVTTSPPAPASRRTVTLHCLGVGKATSAPSSCTGNGSFTKALLLAQVVCARPTATSCWMTPVLTSIAEAPANAAASAAFCSSVRVAMTLATSMPSATNPSMVSM